MKKNYLALAFFFALFAFAGTASAQSIAMSPADLKDIENTEWVGTLTYLDYKTSRPVTIKSNLRLTRDKDRTWIAEYTYPDEPKANSRSTITLSADGQTFNEQKVVGIGSKPGLLKIVTTKDGVDNEKNAQFRYTYRISREAFSIQKQVRLEGETAVFERSKYTWTRKPKTIQQ
jgi:hypothetical protein